MSLSVFRVAGLIALLIGVLPLAGHLAKSPEPEASVTLTLGDRAVRWPYHSSVQRNSWSWFNLPAADQIAQAANDGTAASGNVNVEAETLANNQELAVRAQGPSAEGAIAGLAAVVQAFLEYDMALQRDPIEAELAIVQSDRDRLEEAFLVSEAEIGQASDPADLILLEAELEGLGASIGGIEGEKAEVQGRLNGLTNRYSVTAGPAAVPAFTNALLASFLTAMAAFVLTALAAGVVNARRVD